MSVRVCAFWGEILSFRVKYVQMKPIYRYIPLIEKGEEYMDIAGLSSVMSMEKLQMNVGFAMMSKVMDAMEMSTEAMAEMMDAAAQVSGGVSIPGLGENIDILV